MALFREEVAGLIPALRAFARALTAGERSMADDLVQDTMVNALQAQEQYQPGTNLEAWLFTILRNRFRSLRARRHVTAEVASDDLEHLAVVPAQQEQRLEMLAFRRAFSHLPPSQREMLLLVTVRGLSYEAAAEICGCELGTAKSRVHRARAALKVMLLDEEPAVALSCGRGSSATGLHAAKRARDVHVPSRVIARVAKRPFAVGERAS